VTRFRRRRKTVVVSFAEHEADILANLLRNLVELLYDGMPPRAAESSDPLAALMGDSDGPTSPREGKVSDAKRVLSALEEPGADEIALEPDEQLSWLRALNDLRLAIGTRLDIKQEDDYTTWEKLPDDDPRRLTYDLYDWLGYLQSALLHNMR
jgi:hypothetical protein